MFKSDISSNFLITLNPQVPCAGGPDCFEIFREQGTVRLWNPINLSEVSPIYHNGPNVVPGPATESLLLMGLGRRAFPNIQEINGFLPSERPVSLTHVSCDGNGFCQLPHGQNAEMKVRFRPELTSLYKRGISIPFDIEFSHGSEPFWRSFNYCNKNSNKEVNGTLFDNHPKDGQNECAKALKDANKKISNELPLNYDMELYHFNFSIRLRRIRGAIIFQASSTPDCDMHAVRHDLLWMQNAPEGRDWRNIGCLDVSPSVVIYPPTVQIEDPDFGVIESVFNWINSPITSILYAASDDFPTVQDPDIDLLSVNVGFDSILSSGILGVSGLLIQKEALKAGASIASTISTTLSPLLSKEVPKYLSHYAPWGSPYNPFTTNNSCAFSEPGCIENLFNHRFPGSMTRISYGWFADMFGPRNFAGTKTFIHPVKRVYDEPQPCVLSVPHKDRTDLCIFCKEEDVMYQTVNGDEGPIELIWCKNDQLSAFLPATIFPRNQRHFLEYVVEPQVDSDGDGILDSKDNCPSIADLQYKSIGQPGAWFSDKDSDGVGFLCDNCPLIPNSEQENSDADWIGDACDPCKSLVKDTVCCNSDLDCEAPISELSRKSFCVPAFDIPNVISGLSSLGDFECTGFYGRCTGALDEDRDGIPNNCDNCPLDPNADQKDSNGNGAGDVCEGCGGLNPRIPPDIASSIPAHSLAKYPCDPMEGPHAPAPAHAFCQSKTGNPKSRCVWKNVFLATPVGICTVGPDEDGDGVADNCDNCKSLYNPDQANCNIDAEIVANVSYPYTGDACDSRPCALVSQHSMVLSSGNSPNGIDVSRLEIKPRILPPQVPGAYPFTDPSKTPLATVGNSFCACGDRDGLTRLPHECQLEQLGNCTIDPRNYSEFPEAFPLGGAAGNWTKPALQNKNSLSESWLPAQGTSSVLFSLKMSNANPKVSLESLDKTVPSYPHWNLSSEPTYGPFLASSTPEVSCKDGRGVQGVFWTSVRGALGLTHTFTNDDTDLTSYYEYGQWGVGAVCVKNPGSGSGNQDFEPPEVQSLCFWCGCPMCGFKGLPNYNIYINPGDLAKNALFASDGLLTKKVADVPAMLGEIWSAGDGIWVSASDWFHTNLRGSDLVTLSRDGFRVTSAAYFERGVAVPVRGGRLPGVMSASEGMEPVASQVAPTPRENFEATLSKKKNMLFLAGGMQGNLPQTDLWQMSLESNSWEPLVLPDTYLGRVVAMTYHGPEEVLYAVDEKKVGKVSWMRLVKIDPILRTASMLGMWPKLGLFERYFLSVAQSGDLLLAASRGKGAKGKHFLVVFSTEEERLSVLWTLGGNGDLSQAPALTRDGLTRPFSSAQFNAQRFVPHHELPRPKPKKAKGKLNLPDDRDLFLGCF